MELAVFIMSGALLYRLRGAGIWPSRPWWQILFAVPYVLLAFALGASIFLSLIVGLLTFGALVTGHASYIDLASVKAGAANMPSDGESDEWYGAWLPFTGYWHDFLGLALSGLLISAASGLAIMLNGHFWGGLALGLSGSLKVLGYALSWKGYDVGYEYSPIAVAEALAGALMWGSLGVITLLVL